MDLAQRPPSFVQRALAQALRDIFRAPPVAFALQLWDGTAFHFDDASQKLRTPRFRFVLRDGATLRQLLLRPDPIALAEAYIEGRLDVEGDVYSALSLKHYLAKLRLGAKERARLLLAIAGLPRTRAYARGAKAYRGRMRHTRAHNRSAIAFHYDASNAFYALWLDTEMVYSCAYFPRPDMDLDSAQRAKLDYICRKLRLQPGEHLLDIGCGWGGLLRWAVQHYGVTAHGITLSQEQFAFNQARIRELGLADRISIELRDYRDLKGEAVYDKIVSVGMFEHVGLRQLPAYFATAERLLKNDGLFLNHGITHTEEGWQGDGVNAEFINRYVFPDAELDCVSRIQLAMERAGFEILDVEQLRRHYAETLRHWVKRLETRKAEALQHVSAATYRVWRLYMAACALEFEEGGAGLYQILLSKRARTAPLPRTRADLYA